jgi:DNA polymerase-1
MGSGYDMQDSLLEQIGGNGDRRRVVIIDFNHLAWRYKFSKATGLSVNRLVNGVVQTIDTTIPAYTIKQIVRWANFGVNPTIVCMDSPVVSRKKYFEMLTKKESSFEQTDYKGDRKRADSDFIQSIEITGSLLQRGGVHVFKQPNYEADDLIFACVQKAKKDYPYLPIDIITGDADLIPLVDEQVSVYMKSKVYTYANEVSPLIKGYVQYTPESYQQYAEQLSKFKVGRTVIAVPYNTLLLAKILRGDNSDGLKGKEDWKPRMYNELIEILYDNDEPVEELARYGEWTSTIIDTRTNQPVTSYTKEDIPYLFQRYEEPKELKLLLDVVGKYVEPEDIDFIRDRYIGMCLNGAFLNLPDEYKRRPYEIKLKEPFKGFDINQLQEAVSVLDIRLPMA